MQGHIRKLSIGLWLTFLASVASAETSESTLTGRWVVATEAVAPVRWLELEIEASPAGLQAVTDGYAAVGDGFDARVFAGVPWAGLERAGSALRGELEVWGRTFTLDVRLAADSMEGTLSDGETAHPIVGRRVEALDAEALAAVVGVYDAVDAAGASQIVTWRELGGLRVVDLETGAGAVLDPVEGGRFATRRCLGSPSQRRETLAFAAASGGARDLVWRHPDGRETRYLRRPGISQERVSFHSSGNTLRGTLLRPARDSPVPAVILVHGSGPIYRTALIDRAVRFVELGAAAFVYDKRGTGRSEGSWRDASLEDLAADALAALRRVGGLAGIDRRRLGFQGHSQAGWVIPIAAADRPEVAFAIVVNGGAIPMAESTLWDKENDLRREGYPPEVVDEALALLRRVQAYVEHKEDDDDSLNSAYRAAQAEPWFPVLDLPRLPELPSWEDPPALLVAAHQELVLDPGAFLRRLGEIPVLVLLGAEDETVPPLAVASAWRAAFRGREVDRLQIEVVPGADHGFRDPAATGTAPRVPAYDAVQRQWWERHVAPAPAASEGAAP